MKKRVGIFMTLIAACFLTMSASAQDKLKLELSYDISSPLGSFKNDYINKTSFRGGSGELSYSFNPNFSLGLYSGFQSYYQKYDRQVYKLQGNQVISAVVSNSMDIVPLLLRGTFYPLGSSATAKIQPYVSAGAGVSFVNYSQYLGEFGGSQTSATFAAQAGAGIVIPFGSIDQNGIKIGATYNYTSYNQNSISKLNSVGVNAGVVFGLK